MHVPQNMEIGKESEAVSAKVLLPYLTDSETRFFYMLDISNICMQLMLYICCHSAFILHAQIWS